MKITKKQLRKIINEEKAKLQEGPGIESWIASEDPSMVETSPAGGMGHVPAPDTDLYELGYDDGASEEEVDPMYSKNASYMKGYADGLMNA